MFNIKTLQTELNEAQNEVSRYLGKKQSLEKDKNEIINRLKEVEGNNKIFDESSKVLQQVGNIMKNSTIERIETLITKGIRDILGEANLEFKIKYRPVRDVIEAEYAIHDKLTGDDYDIIESFGGGLKDIISILQRIIFIYQFNLSKVLILDEAGKWISEDKQPAFGKFLSIISKRLDIQIILISHRNAVVAEADKVFRIVKRKDISQMEIVKDDESTIA